MHILLIILLDISLIANKENQEFHELAITSFILTTLICDSGVLQWGEIRS